MKNILEFTFSQKKTIAALIFILAFGGVIFFITTVKESYPSVDMRKIIVVARYPGASPAEIESQIVNKIENALLKVEGIKNVISFIRDGVGRVRIKLYSDYPKSTESVKTEIQNEIDQIKNFPSNLEDKPIVSVPDIELSPVLDVAISGGNDIEDLYEFTDKVRDAFLDIKQVNNVEIGPDRNKEIWIEIDPKKLRMKNINILDVSKAIKDKNLDIPSGVVDIDNIEYSLSAKGQYQNIDEVKNTLIRVNDYGRAVYLKDISDVTWNRSEMDFYYYKNNEPVVSLSIIKKSKTDIIGLVDNVKKVIEKFKDDKNNARFSFTEFSDVSQFVKRRLSVLTSNAFLGALLVFICLIFFFDMKSTFYASMTLPLSFAIAFFFSSVFGNTLNMITMFGFIIVVGMIVDNAILVIENIYVHLSKKPEEQSIKDTILNAVEEVFSPLVASILTTIAAFLPMLIIKTTTGKLLGFIAPIVTYTILSSFFICVFYLPPALHKSLTRRLKKNSKFKIATKAVWLNKLSLKYQKLLSLTMTHSKKFLFGVLIFCIFIAVMTKNFLPKEFFIGELEDITVNVEFPNSFSLEQTRAQVHLLEKEFIKKVSDNTDYISVSVGRWKHPFASGDKYQDYYGSFKFYLKPVGKVMSDGDFIVKLNEVLDENKDKLSIVKNGFNYRKSGPPSSSALTFRFFGNNINEIKKFLDESTNIAKNIPNITGVNSTYSLGQKELYVKVDEGLASQYGIKMDTIANTIRNVFKGTKATVANHLYRKSVDIIVKYDENSTHIKDEKELLNKFQNFQIKNIRDDYVRLGAFAQFEFGNSLASIMHYNRNIVLTLSGDLKDENDRYYTSTKVNEIFDEKIKPLLQKYPNISIGQGGARETNIELLNSVEVALVLSIGIMFFVLTLLFRNYSHTFIIMSVIPLGVISVCVGLFIHYYLSFLFPIIDKKYYAFNFMTTLGVVALGGVLVNNSTILVSVINQLSKSSPNMTLKEAVVKGSSSRLRPILITTLTTLVGMIPFSYGLMGGEPFLQPMGIALVWGLFLGSGITMFFVPILYYSIEKRMKKIRKKIIVREID